MEGRLRQLLHLVGGFVFILCIWTNRIGNKFLGVVQSHLDKVFNGHTVLQSSLFVVQLPAPHKIARGLDNLSERL